ncbi:hypothetical protein [Bacillus sp. FJAT-26390]|uniref:hypothetical protein n=1 Tax=Bacillus sp. FJAT-26390 TaxID=1743142 RepID=UPI000807EBEA|nr:hypothetical protein [Bacillus sp. FJAT-26390]OBZ16497.1 hypothetical protein A7975_00790 [Bacillus sp. FJAT-26390]
MTGVRAVIIDPFFEQPNWLSKVEYRETVYLSKNSTEEDAVLFLTLLCGFNNISIDKEPNEFVQELIRTDEVALSGGIAFEGQGKLILPSCCCGLEQWREVKEAVKSKKDIWLGHDPFPTIEYIDESVRIWSDDYIGNRKKEPITEQERQKMFFITYSHHDLIEQMNVIEMDLLDFFKYPLVNALSMVDTGLLDELFAIYRGWFRLAKK